MKFIIYSNQMRSQFYNCCSYQMGLKTTSTASCEWLTIFIKLPSETREKVELSVKSDAIDLYSPK